jgi:acetyl esterase/lipase
MNELGITAFVVKYRLNEYGFPAPLLDGLRAMRLVRRHFQEWNLNPNKIGVIGFSAGGHLAATLATRFDFVGEKNDSLKEISARPDFAVLGYPVITLEGRFAHLASRKALLGESPAEALVRENSLQYHVNNKTPPTFLFHGADDQAVSANNSTLFYQELLRFNRQSELHIYQSSVHGVGMQHGYGSISTWPQALTSWLAQNGCM